MKRHDDELTMTQLLVALLLLAFVANTALFICVVGAQEANKCVMMKANSQIKGK